MALGSHHDLAFACLPLAFPTRPALIAFAITMLAALLFHGCVKFSQPQAFLSPSLGCKLLFTSLTIYYIISYLHCACDIA